MSELTSNGAGTGITTGAATGVTTGITTGGGGGGGGGRWAWADVDAIAMASAKAIATGLASRRPAPQPPARKSHDEQRIDAIPKGAPARQKNAKSPSARADLPPVFAERQSVVIPGKGRLPGVVVPLPQVRIGDLRAEQIS